MCCKCNQQKGSVRSKRSRSCKVLFFAKYILDFNVELTVKCEPKQQEIVSQMATLNKYEAESKVTGSYQGEVVQGTCCVELLGTWK